MIDSCQSQPVSPSYCMYRAFLHDFTFTQSHSSNQRRTSAPPSDTASIHYRWAGVHQTWTLPVITTKKNKNRRNFSGPINRLKSLFNHLRSFLYHLNKSFCPCSRGWGKNDCQLQVERKNQRYDRVTFPSSPGVFLSHNWVYVCGWSRCCRTRQCVRVSVI